MKEFLKPEVRSDLRFLYENGFGRFLLKIATRPWVSKIAGKYLDSRLSRRLIPGFIEKNHILAHEAEEREYRSFNDYFTRTLKPGLRPFSEEADDFTSPADSLLSVYPIEKDSVFSIKNSRYTVSSLLRDEELAARFEGGWCCIFRLTVSDYHRYSYFDSGVQQKNVRLKGKLHTVNPIAEEHYRIYAENAREYAVIETENFGVAVQMEVGALLVGRIVNHKTKGEVRRGEEKGCFQYGGSTVIVLLQKDTAVFDADLLEASRKGLEWKVKLGQTVGRKK